MASVVSSFTTNRRSRLVKWMSLAALGGALAAAAPLLMRAQSAPAPSAFPGLAGDGSTLLSNGWRIQPVGQHLPVGNLPLNVLQSPDGRYLIVTNNGLAAPSLSVIDVATWTVKNTVPLGQAWLGLAWHPDGTKLYASGADLNTVQEFRYADGLPTRARTFTLPTVSGPDSFVGAIAISPDGRTLYATRVFATSVSSIDLASGQVLNTATLPAEPYAAVIAADGRRLYVSIWGGAEIQVFDAASMRLVGDWTSGEHPNAMVLSRDGRRLFVACGSSASVWVYDTTTGEPIEQVSTSLYPEAPPTSTPNSLALSPDGQTLLVATADNNAVALVDVSNSVRSAVSGFVPTGAYPTGAIFSRDGKQLFILSGKGMTPLANPGGGGLSQRLLGTVTAVPTPDRTTLAEYTRRVLALAPYSDATRLTPVGVPIGSPIPRSVGGASPIKHVFYIIRENRTYDQVLGDMSQGNGAPDLAIFGAAITPNAHAIAQNFVLFDNFYVDADISYNGHAFSTAAYATDFVEKMWPTQMAGRGGPYLAEGTGLMRNPFGNITAPPGGYLWDYAQRAGVSVRSYGEFVQHTSRAPNGDVVAVESVPGLAGLVAPSYAGWDLDITDNQRADHWQQEFAGQVARNTLPSLSIIRLPNDHTNGTKPGAPTPRAMLADNDLALGRIVETISGSVYWKDSAILVLEDDAQAGPDHVDSHRSVLLLASPFAKHGSVDHSFYTTSGVLRTIELLLGLPPMSQYDAAATPMYAAFDSTPNLATYRRLDARVPLDEKNLATAYGAAQSLAMDFSDADRTPELLLNEILWRSIKGADSRMPPPRRSLFVRGTATGDDDDRDR